MVNRNCHAIGQLSQPCVAFNMLNNAKEEGGSGSGVKGTMVRIPLPIRIENYFWAAFQLRWWLITCSMHINCTGLNWPHYLPPSHSHYHSFLPLSFISFTLLFATYPVRRAWWISCLIGECLVKFPFCLNCLYLFNFYICLTVIYLFILIFLQTALTCWTNCVLCRTWLLCFGVYPCTIYHPYGSSENVCKGSADRLRTNFPLKAQQKLLLVKA